jgi:hypothetical protein
MNTRYPPAGAFGGRGGVGSMASGGGSTASGAVGCLSHVRLTAGAKLSRYLRRLVHVTHMDFEVRHTCSTSIFVSILFTVGRLADGVFIGAAAASVSQFHVPQTHQGPMGTRRPGVSGIVECCIIGLVMVPHTS